jgi:hypothetical protein
MARGLPHRSLRRFPDRSPLSTTPRSSQSTANPIASMRQPTLRQTRASTPQSQTMIAEQPEPPPAGRSPSNSNTCTPTPIEPPAKSTINRPEPHNPKKGPKRGPFRIPTIRRRILYGSSLPTTALAVSLQTPAKIRTSRESFIARRRPTGLPIEGNISSNPNSRHNNKVVMAPTGIYGPEFECHGHHRTLSLVSSHEIGPVLNGITGEKSS